MVGCCVPFCYHTSAKKNSTKISFHQFPSNAKLRELWIKNISREADKRGLLWSPSDSPELVCSLHFNPNDFRKGLKYQQILRKIAVPTVFTNYLPHMQQMIAKNVVPENSKNVEIKTEVVPENSKNVEIKTEEDHLNSNDPNCKENYSNAVKNEPVCNIVTKDAATQAQFLFPSKYKTSNNLQNTLQLLKSKKVETKKLISQIDFLQKQIQIIKNKSQKSLEKKLLSIVEQAESNNSLGDKFFIELFRTFQNPLHKWSEDSLKACIIFFDEFPDGYQFIQDLGLIDLPEEKTLMDYAGCSLATNEEAVDEIM